MGRQKLVKPGEVSFTELMEGLGMETEPYEKRKAGVGSWSKLLAALVVISILCGLLLSAFPLLLGVVGVQAVRPVAQVWKDMPDTLPETAIAQRNTFYDANGAPFAQLWEENRIALKSLDQISPYAKQGLIDTEDKRFYYHKGFDPKGTFRSAVTGSGGGSGITQQLIKNLQYYNLLGRSKQEQVTARSYSRKLQELKLATEYEKTHTKDQILLTYFNTVAMGGPNIYGIETASRYYFGKPAKQLDIAEAAMLVGSVQNPSLYDFARESTAKARKARQEEVIGRLLAEGHITRAQANAAVKKKVIFVFKRSGGGNCYSSKYPYYCKYVLDYLKASPRLGATQKERDAILVKGGLQVHTHLDPNAMSTINNYLKGAFGIKNRIVAPTALVQPGTGGVTAFGQNRDWGYGKGKTEIVVANTKSGEGSVYKIFMLAAALNSGMSESDLAFSSACPLRPGPKYDAPPGGFKNSSSCALQGGYLNYKQATAYSSNTWYVTLEMKVGVEKLKEFSKSVGLSAPAYIDNRSLSYTLGSVENSPINLAAAFATFANKGVYCPPTPVVSIAYTDGGAVALPDNYDPKQEACRQVISPKNAGIVLKAMRANLDGSVPKAFGMRSNIPHYDTVGKSGTNEDLNSTWIHMAKSLALFINVYDMDRPSRGVDGLIFKGESTPWYHNTAQSAGADMMKLLLKGKPNQRFTYVSSDNSISPVAVDQSAFMVVPNVIGMEPADALAVMQATGVKTVVSKEFRPLPAGYPSGVIVASTPIAGERLSKGTKKTITLYIGK